MRRVASSRPRRGGMDTIRGLDNSSLHGCEEAYGGRQALQPSNPPGRGALLSPLKPAPGRARRSVDEAGTAMTAGSKRVAPSLIAGRHGLCRILPERAGVGRVHVSHARDDTKMTCTRSAPMRPKAPLYLTVAAIGIASVLAAAPAQLRAQTAVAIDNDDIGGVGTAANGPEAGVWVIAETADLPTRYAKIVVTDDQGRYVLPDLPKAKYKVWVRGYGLVDSPKVDGEPGQQLNLRAAPAP